MSEINILKDSAFLKDLDRYPLKEYFAKIVVLNASEIPLAEITGRVTSGSISINGDSAIRRSGSITFVADEYHNDLTNVDSLLSINKKIIIYEGITNNINKHYDDIIWFKLGVFVISNPSISHNINSVTINLQFKDKMCLLNGELGGNLPTSVTFDSYDQQLGLMEVQCLPSEPLKTYVYYLSQDDGIYKSDYYLWNPTSGWEISSKEAVNTVISVKQRIFDIIQTAVCNFGGEAIEKIIINDVPLELKQIVRYVGNDTLYYNAATGIYTTEEQSGDEWRSFEYNQDCGYVYTDFVYAGSLVTGIGENVCSVLSKIVSQLGNYEFFYDINGNFVFQEKKNYLNTTYNPVQYQDGTGTWHYLSTTASLLDHDNYFVDFANVGESIYTFENEGGLISSYTNTPNYSNIKNDYHIWGKASDGAAIHYHVAIKEKPAQFNQYIVVYEKDELTEEYTGRVTLITDVNGSEEEYKFLLEKLLIDGTVGSFQSDKLLSISNNNIYSSAFFDNEDMSLKLSNKNIDFVLYTPTDWRAELYLQGAAKKLKQIRPDVYEQELLDLWDSIYDMRNHCFKEDIVNNPNNLAYWFDFIEPYNKLHNVSVDAIGIKIQSFQQDSIKKLYNTDVPDRILINNNDTEIQRISMITKCQSVGQDFSNVPNTIYSNVAIGTMGYVAQESARDLMYQHTDYSESINLSSIPIYYLEPNTRITVQDNASGINGDYVIKTINLPLDGKSFMTINALKTLNRL